MVYPPSSPFPEFPPSCSSLLYTTPSCVTAQEGDVSFFSVLLKCVPFFFRSFGVFTVFNFWQPNLTKKNVSFFSVLLKNVPFFFRSFGAFHCFNFLPERYVLLRSFCVLFRSLQKNGAFFPFFSVLCKRTKRSFRSFPFFVKECYVLSVLFRSLEKNGKERNVLLGSDKSPKTWERTEKNVTFSF